VAEALIRDFQNLRVIGRNLNRITERVEPALKGQIHIGQHGIPRPRTPASIPSLHAFK
jgi:hypothetical protein